MNKFFKWLKSLFGGNSVTVLTVGNGNKTTIRQSADTVIGIQPATRKEAKQEVKVLKGREPIARTPEQKASIDRASQKLAEEMSRKRQVPPPPSITRRQMTDDSALRSSSNNYSRRDDDDFVTTAIVASTIYSMSSSDDGGSYSSGSCDSGSSSSCD